jgi:hypothetical protein
MATLVQFLAAGVNGAASGSATFLVRGTASSAQSVMYNEFEGLTQPATNVVTLDSNGAAEVYVDAYVDVEIKNSAGTTLRTVTVGNSAPLVEVQSTSFTGTDYDGSPANTIGEPITLKAVLDKWILSAGAADWQVLVDGVATDLDEAVAGFTGMFTNVKSDEFGATGDGVTDDTTAILAATTAANGGIVFFPPGTYKLDELSLSGANINWWGSGAGSTIISGITGAALISLTNNTNTGWKNFRSLSFTSSGTYDRLFLLEESQNVSFDRCVFDASQCTADCIATTAAAGLSKYFFSDCDFTFGASTPRGIYNQAAIGARYFSLSGCNFKVPVGFTGSMLVGADFIAEGCRFDASAVVAGVYRHVDAESQTVAGRYVGNFSGNTFLDGGSTGFVFKLTGLGSSCDFSESGNTFVGFTVPTASAAKGQTYEITNAESGVPGDIHLGSRKGRTINITNTGAAFTVSCCLEAENVVIEQSAAAPTITVPALIPGLSGRVIVFMANGEPDRSVAFVDSATLGTFLHTTTVNEEAMLANAGSDEVTSCSYFTTVRGDGTFRSLITSEVNHHA